MKKLLLVLSLCLALLASGGMIGYSLGGRQEIENLRDQLAYYQREQSGTYEWLYYQLQELEQNYLRAAYKPPVKEYVDVMQEVPVYISIEVPVEVEKTVVRYIQPRYFNDVAEAEAWVEENHLPIVLIASDGVIDLRTNQDPRYDCDDYAEDFETAALNAGYRIWQTPVQNGRIWGVWVTDIPGNHVGNMTKIQNAYYYIESSPSPHRWKLTKIMEAD